MDGLVELYLQRAENELVAAQVLFEVSRNPILQKELKLERDFTFYSDVIGHAYYCIFNSAKAILLTEGIRTYPPDLHRKTIDAFEKYLVNTGKLDVQLLNLYRKSIVQAEELLGIYSLEKDKRGTYTYQKLPQANMKPASDSLENASLFFRNIGSVLRNR
jgi:uncharacterized protein (UPF0332 family)